MVFDIMGGGGVGVGDFLRKYGHKSFVQKPRAKILYHSITSLRQIGGFSKRTIFSYDDRDN